MVITNVNQIKIDDYPDCYVLIVEGTQRKSSTWTRCAPEGGRGGACDSPRHPHRTQVALTYADTGGIEYSLWGES
jgi:hypothetical protein